MPKKEKDNEKNNKSNSVVFIASKRHLKGLSIQFKECALQKPDLTEIIHFFDLSIIS